MKRLAAGILAGVLMTPLAVFAADHDGDAKHAPADNTGKNVRDRDDSKLVPTDQAKGSDGDVEVTRKIRQAIVDDDGLSTNAHNVKIVTLNGVTTLRGPVATAAEKTKVAEYASRVVGDPVRVKNELEVAP